MHVSYLYGLFETIIILTFIGLVSSTSFGSFGSGGQGSSLQGSVKTGSP